MDEDRSPDVSLKRLASALRAIDTLTIPPELAAQRVEYTGIDFLKRHMPELPKIYGLNTLPGHKVNEAVPEKELLSFQLNLIASHRIGSGPCLDEETARAVTYAKLFAAATGNTLISRALYESMLKAATSASFRPQIPAHASYSSGDVIPAAHWTQDLLDWEEREHKKKIQLQPGEGMALINGCFVHLGVTLRLVRRLRDFWNLYIDTAEQSLRLLGADARVLDEPSTSGNAWFRATMRHVGDSLQKENGDRRSSAVQDPVSIRSLPQQAQAAIFAIEGLFLETEAVLGRPSGNPLMLRNREGGLDIRPSGSFDQPALALATGSVIEALLMLAWNSVRRTVHLLNGEHGFPRDGATENDRLGMIQWPKLAQAALEKLRGEMGTRNFTSGSSTSGDTEDFWTNGTELSLKAGNAIDGVEKILMIERLAGERLRRVVARDGAAGTISPASISLEKIAGIKAGIGGGNIPFPLKL